MDYKQAGVNISAAEKLVDRIKEMVKTTRRPGVIGNIGLFGGVFDLQAAGASMRLIASTDGVGTKTVVATWANRFDTIGECLVNHCVNDIAVMGADPLFLLDTVATDKLVAERDTALLEGLVRGCVRNNLALVGGETAELTDVFLPGQFDLGATIIGCLPVDVPVLDGSRIQPGDELWGLCSTGLHTNGYTLARKVLLEKARLSQHEKLSDGTTVADALLAVHRSYLEPIKKLRCNEQIHGFSHITGGGIVGNTKRLLRPGLGLEVMWGNWQELPIFDLIRRHGDVSDDAMHESMNLGIGLVVVAAPGLGATIRELLDEEIYFVGNVTGDSQ